MLKENTRVHWILTVLNDLHELIGTNHCLCKDAKFKTEVNWFQKN